MGIKEFFNDILKEMAKVQKQKEEEAYFGNKYECYKISDPKKTMIDEYLKPYCERIRNKKPFNRNIFYSAMHDLDLCLEYENEHYDKIKQKILNTDNTEAKIIFKKVCTNVFGINIKESTPVYLFGCNEFDDVMKNSSYNNFRYSKKFAAGAFYLTYGASLLKNYNELLKGPDFIINKLKQEGWY